MRGALSKLRKEKYAQDIAQKHHHINKQPNTKKQGRSFFFCSAFSPINDYEDEDELNSWIWKSSRIPRNWLKQCVATNDQARDEVNIISIKVCLFIRSIYLLCPTSNNETLRTTSTNGKNITKTSSDPHF
jgi:hypothetical protein